MPNLNDVKKFWNNNPLWSGESDFEPGSLEFFEEHRSVVIEDCFAGSLDERCLPTTSKKDQQYRILDLGCGIGFWVTEFAMLGYKNLYAVDLTEEAIKLTKKRLEIYNYKANLSVQNAENLDFENETFDHVNCQGVIHHTPYTHKCISEISRILKSNGTANISVYYRNPILRFWKILRYLHWPLSLFGGGLKGRGRDSIFKEKNVDEIVRLYDGKDNPIGKSYTKSNFVKILEPHFLIKETYLHFFPARALPFKMPVFIHKWLDRTFGFMIYASVKKK